MSFTLKEGDRVAYLGICSPRFPPSAYVGTVDAIGELDGKPVVYVRWDDGGTHRAPAEKLGPERPVRRNLDA